MGPWGAQHCKEAFSVAHGCDFRVKSWGLWGPNMASKMNRRGHLRAPPVPPWAPIVSKGDLKRLHKEPKVTKMTPKVLPKVT